MRLHLGTHGDVWLLTAGLALFATLAHRSGFLLALALSGLLTAAIVLALRGFAVSGRATLFALTPADRVWPLGLLLAAVTGVLLGMWNRLSLGQSMLPETLLPFALIATSIGIAEEVVFRGFVFGRIIEHGASTATLVAAGSHTLYKVCLYLLPPGGIRGDLGSLALWTFAGGLLFGFMRARLGGLLVPTLAHAAFDMVVYGDTGTAPWWVF